MSFNLCNLPPAEKALIEVDKAATQRILADKTRHIQSATHSDRDWNRLIPHLHRLPLTKNW